MPLTSLAMLLGFFSFAGIPPLAGFIAKYLVFTAAIGANLGWLAVIGVLTTVIQTAYLLRIVTYMYAKEPVKVTKFKEPRLLLVPIFILVAIIIVLGVYPSIILNLIDPVIQQLPFMP